MKSYTDLEQSKRLAEILPIESADMHYSKDFDGSWFVDLAEYTSVKIPKYVDKVEEHLLPCWSLAALLEAIPQEIFDGEYIINITEGLNNRWVLTYDHYENRNPSYYGLSTSADNLIDACYEMIIKLKGNNLL